MTMTKQRRDGRIGYACKTDFDWENSCEVYDSVEVLKRKRPCVEECGIVKVEMKLLEIVEDGEI